MRNFSLFIRWDLESSVTMTCQTWGLCCTASVKILVFRAAVLWSLCSRVLKHLPDNDRGCINHIIDHVATRPFHVQYYLAPVLHRRCQSSIAIGTPNGSASACPPKTPRYQQSGDLRRQIIGNAITEITYKNWGTQINWSTEYPSLWIIAALLEKYNAVRNHETGGPFMLQCFAVMAGSRELLYDLAKWYWQNNQN